jgi:metal-responsive CopG/Arc/MetJ family transcriptional regulator
MSLETEKITVSLPRETLRLADEQYAAFGFSNRSEFIDAAIRE